MNVGNIMIERIGIDGMEGEGKLKIEEGENGKKVVDEKGKNGGEMIDMELDKRENMDKGEEREEKLIRKERVKKLRNGKKIEEDLGGMRKLMDRIDMVEKEGDGNDKKKKRSEKNKCEEDEGIGRIGMDEKGKKEK